VARIVQRKKKKVARFWAVLSRKGNPRELKGKTAPTGKTKASWPRTCRLKGRVTLRKRKNHKATYLEGGDLIAVNKNVLISKKEVSNKPGKGFLSTRGKEAAWWEARGKSKEVVVFLGRG